MRWFRKKTTETPILFDSQKEIPNHIAIIMDGNGRWAKNLGMPRVAGHREGMQRVKTIALHAKKLGVKVVTLYAFSTENWKRPDEEVSFLMKLPIDFFKTFIPQLNENNIRVETMGLIDQLPKATQKAVLDAVEATKYNDGMILNFALNYGSRLEMIDSMKKMVHDYKDSIEDITEEVFSRYLWSSPLGEYSDPDLLIRTSGEERISNFMLWQIAYSEIYFTSVHWPDFKEQHLEEAIGVYQKRHRRFGGL